MNIERGKFDESGFMNKAFDIILNNLQKTVEGDAPVSQFQTPFEIKTNFDIEIKDEPRAEEEILKNMQ
jgi:hypothetical protein